MIQPRDEAVAIWHAAVAAVAADQLVERAVRIDPGILHLAGTAIRIDDVRHLCVVGAGKAAAGMAEGLQRGLGPELLDRWSADGWLNVPAGCIRQLDRFHLHAARAAGQNEPTEAGCAGSRRIVEMVGRLTEHDLCVALISGGGSALLPAPAGGISLEDKLAVTRMLSASGASIQQLNTVRRALSDIKGGGLARRCRAGRLVALIISDVVGDPLELIASGPTVATPVDPAAARDVLKELGLEGSVPPSVRTYLDGRPAAIQAPPSKCQVSNHIIGNNATAVEAAAAEAARRGYRVERIAPEAPSTTAEEVGRELARRALDANTARGRCVVWGGEPVVKLPPVSVRGRGGRNQQAILAALHWLREHLPQGLGSHMALLSGGTDGEDGPTDAAGALLDRRIDESARQLQLEPQTYLERCDAYSFFQQTGGLLISGPTGTNVGDLRIAIC